MLVIGASGGVGSFVVQIAKACGAEVTGVGSTAKMPMMRALGADDVFDYTRDDITAGGKRYDVVLDIGGNRSRARLRRALAAGGTLVIVGGETGGRWLGGIDRLLGAFLMSPFVFQNLRTLTNSENGADLCVLTDFTYEDGNPRQHHREHLEHHTSRQRKWVYKIGAPRRRRAHRSRRQRGWGSRRRCPSG